MTRRRNSRVGASGVRAMHLAAAALLLAPAAAAQWQLRAPGLTVGDPGIAAAYHAGAGVIATVGQRGATLFDGRRHVTIPGPAPARLGAAMTYDRARNRVVLFGGMVPAGAELSDTWEFDGTTWTQRTPATGPSARTAAVLVFDERRNVSVLVGGWSNGLGTGETWEWNGTAWTLRTVRTPGVRGGGAGTFDVQRGVVLMYGGSTTFGGPVRNDFWRFDGVDWVRYLIAVPPSRTGASMSCDRWTGRILLYGGDLGGGALTNETWQWNGIAWTQVTGPVPPARANGAQTYDEQRHTHVVLGGVTPAGGAEEAWSWTADPRPYAARYGDGCAGRTIAPAANSVPELGTSFVLSVGTPANPLAVALGFSNLATPNGPLPQPLPASPGCDLWVDPVAALLITPGPGGTLPIPIPPQPSFAGIEFSVQTVEIDPVGPVPLLASNGVDARAGFTAQPSQTTAALDAVTTDAATSALPSAGAVGGDGRHGTFDPTIGTNVEPGVYELDTASVTIPGRLTRSGDAETVTDGRFFFTDFTIPAGVTVRLRGPVAPQIHVRGTVRIDGVLDASADTMPSFTWAGPNPNTPGQPGGRGGAGGGRGGRGGDRCTGLGPTMVGGVNMNDGVAGEDVHLPAGHAFAAQAIGTGGRGTPLHPTSGLTSSLTFTIQNIFSGQLAAGGGGGGHRAAGAAGAVVPHALLTPGPNTPGGLAFGLPVVPTGTASLAHYLAGGSGGGGGGSHPFLGFSTHPNPWRAGAGGSGGGGAVALRCGRDLVVGASGSVRARGGDGPVFSTYFDGVPCPGGGGAGGSLLLQATGSLQNLGMLDVTGGTGSVTDIVFPTVRSISTGGPGSAGLLRLESPNPIAGGATSPALGAGDTGPLLDVDARSGIRSTWLAVGPPADPAVLVRYELTVTWNGNTHVFSDDPAAGVPIADPTGQIVGRFQGTRADTTGNPDPAQAGPWRRAFGFGLESCNLDAPAFVRIDLTYPTANRPIVQSLRLFWRHVP